MDIKLNILPPEEKSEIANRQGRRKVFAAGIFGFGFILIFLVLLLTILFYLTIQLDSEQKVVKDAQSSSEGKIFDSVQKDISDANDKLKNFNNLEKDSVVRSQYLEALVALKPAGIQFSQLSFDGDKINLEGLAASRDDLIVFRDALNKSEYFSGLDAPLSNFLKQADIDFSFSFLIKKIKTQ